MKLINTIKKHEMLRRWAIGEVHVEFLDDINQPIPHEQLRKLNSGDLKFEDAAINEVLKTHHQSLVDCIPLNTSWNIGLLELSQIEFNKLNTLPVPDLARITNYTYRVAYGAKIMRQHPDLNPRIEQIKAKFSLNKNLVQLSGITLLAKNVDGPYTIIEGNGRLISLYQLLFLEKNSVITDNFIEVVIGFSDKGII